MLITYMSSFYAHGWPVAGFVREKEITSAHSDRIPRFTHPHARRLPAWKQRSSHIFTYRSRPPNPRNRHGLYKLVAAESLHVAI